MKEREAMKYIIQENVQTTDEYPASFPDRRKEFERHGVVAVIRLESEKAAVLVYKFKSGSVVHVLGSRALFERWRRSRA